jgi:hypothetical protein
MMPVGTTVGTVYLVFTTLHMIVIAISRPFLPRSRWSSRQSLRFAIRLLHCTWLSPQSQEALVCVYYAAGDYCNNQIRLCRMSARLQMIVTTISTVCHSFTRHTWLSPHSEKAFPYVCPAPDDRNHSYSRFCQVFIMPKVSVFQTLFSRAPFGFEKYPRILISSRT